MKIIGFSLCSWCCGYILYQSVTALYGFRKWLGIEAGYCFGDVASLPLSLAELRRTTPGAPNVVEAYSGRLTAHVHHLLVNGRDWNLKLKRPRSLVKSFRFHLLEVVDDLQSFVVPRPANELMVLSRLLVNRS